LYYVALSQFDLAINNLIEEMDFCSYAMTVGGVLNDQVTTYAGTKKNMEDRVGYAGGLMIDRLGLNSNVTVSVPLQV